MIEPNTIETFKNKMIDVNNLPEFPGFTVYDAETGEQVGVHNGYKYMNFAITEKAEIMLHERARNGNLKNCIALPKNDIKYIIQLGNGECYKW